MKKIAVFFIVTLFAFRTAEAQNLDGLLRLLGIGESSEQTERTAEESATSTLTAEGLKGEWLYNEPVLRYDGSDVLGSIGVKAVEAMLPMMYAKAGLSAGNGLISFTASNMVSGQLGEYKVSGRYKYSSEDGALILSAQIGAVNGVLHGIAAMEGDALILLFEAQEAAEIVERVSSKAASNDTFKMMKSLLDKYPGVKLGCKLKR